MADKNGIDGLIATNAIATAADRSVPAIVTRRVEKKRVCVNECEFFIFAAEVGV
jgi:hypothetical protein